VSGFELRLIAYGIAFALLCGASAWGGHVITRNHYLALMERQEKASSLALEAAQMAALERQDHDAASIAAAEKKVVEVSTSNSALQSQLADGLRRYAALSARALSQATAGAGKPDDSAARTESARRLAQAVERVSAGCLGDATELAGFQARELSEQESR